MYIQSGLGSTSASQEGISAKPPWSPALLVSSSPSLKCIIFTKDYGPISLCATPTSSRPLVESLSFISVENLASACCCSSEESNTQLFDHLSDFEVPVFRRNDNTKTDRLEVASNSYNDDINDNVSRLHENALELISQMKSLQDRLSDASLALKLKQEAGEVEHFLRRSEAIAHEFISAIEQQRQQQDRLELRLREKRKRRRGNNGHDAGIGQSVDTSSNSGDTANLSMPYYEALQTQLHEVECQLKTFDHNMDDKIGVNTKNAPNLLTINQELNKITIAYNDQHNRRHELVAQLMYNFPTASPAWTCDLPVEFEPKWTCKDQLPAAVQQYFEIITAHQPLWNELDDIDANAWVLEPFLPARRSSTERRVALRNTGGSLSIHIVLDPLRPRNIPISMRLVGSSVDVGELRNTYREYTMVKGTGQCCWSADLSVRENLKLCFGFPLPSPATTEKADYVAECGICYVHHLPSSDSTAADDDGKEEGVTSTTTIPSIMCKNPSCSRSYHESCLFEWLHSLPTARVSFDRIFGTCPYCCESISVKTRT